ncbi:MAG: magnesium/cobalt transporter CorA, partial [Planctomycetes bacterium]|nr:magnesium/cobalt transporter CorA [Planctomycetota bacterium]
MSEPTPPSSPVPPTPPNQPANPPAVGAAPAAAGPTPGNGAAAANGGRRARKRRRRLTPVGASPGTIAPPPDALPLELSAIAYGRGGVTEKRGATLAEIQALRRLGGVVWIDVVGLADPTMLRALGAEFDLHRLAVEDVANVGQRAKVEDYDEHTFVVLRMIDAQHPTETEQLAMFVGPDYVLTFQERPGDCFQMVRQRLRDPHGQMQKRGSDYLGYALLDAVVDGYFPTLERLDDRIEQIEHEILAEKQPKDAVAGLHAVRRALLELRRAVWPLREATSALLRGEGRNFSADVRPYLRDVHDHIVQLIDLLENQRELTSSLLDLHLSHVNHRLNEVMKLLTIISTIFIPLTFLVGVYGMNFDWMPELRVWWGYPACMA